jgi:hypothetical protein
MPDPLEVRISLEGMPETLADMRRELARAVRQRADQEPPAVAAALRQVADDFEAGVAGDVPAEGSGHR